MYPIALNVEKISLLLVGQGERVTSRLAALKSAGATQVNVQESPTDEDIKNAAVVMVVGLPRDKAEGIANKARAAGKLVNVEDANDLCDFYFTANIQRGDLIIAVSTSGSSPTLARKIRDYIGRIFGKEWEQRTADAAQKRHAWKAEGKTMQQMMAASEEYIEKEGWLTHD